MTTAFKRPPAVRPDFVPADDYTSPEFLKLEYQRMWTKVWQIACREEEIPKVGDYLTYEIGDQSFIIVRSAPDKIRALYNVCLHRGRRLMVGEGNAIRFHCTYHGWQWDLNGHVARVLDRDDWKDCAHMSDADLQMEEARVDTWQGFVFINMDPQAEPLAQYLGAAGEALAPYEYGKMRYRLYATFRIPCNWKVAQEAFNEGYHVAATHPQLLNIMGDDYTRSHAHGRHSMFTYDYEKAPIGQPSPRLNKKPLADLREGIIAFYDMMNRQLPVLFSLRDGAASRRIMAEGEATDPPQVLWGKALQLQREAALAEGAGWPDLTPEQAHRAGADWHVFPNMVTLPYHDGCLVYRSRPDGDNPDSCIYDVWGLERYAPGAEPTLVRHDFTGPDAWRKVADVSLILQQDFENMEQVQKGMKSRGFKGNRPSPKQEVAVSNMHRALHEYLFDDET